MEKEGSWELLVQEDTGPRLQEEISLEVYCSVGRHSP